MPVISESMSMIIQYGFAGMSIILLFVIIWLIRELITLLKANQVIISENSKIMHTMDDHIKTQIEQNKNLNEKLLSRPCIAKGE